MRRIHLKVIAILFIPILTAFSTTHASGQQARSEPLDILRLGDDSSESGHHLSAERSDVIKGGLELAARRLLPFDPPQNDGGKLSFMMKCDPEKQNYVTIKLWGSDHGRENGRLYLFMDGKQVGHRHLGDITPLDIGTDDAACPGRFFYSTLPLPRSMTQGKTSVEIEIRARGWLYGYGVTYESFQRKLALPTRGIYAVYVHTDGYFVPPADERQGATPAHPPVRTQPGEERIADLKAAVNKALTGALGSKRPLKLEELKFLAHAYRVPWSVAYQKPEVTGQVARGIDAAAQKQNLEPDTVKKVGWSEYGPAGDAIRLLGDAIKPVLDEAIDDGRGTKIARRELWSKMLQEGRDYKRTHRQLYTNQTMIADMNIYLANRGLQVIDPAHAFTEEQALRYVYEATGVLPWLGNDLPNGKSERRLGDDFHVLTEKGLSRELGYVGYYGEVIDWAMQINDATDFQNDKLKAQTLKMSHARSFFRYPSVDSDGNRAMRLESIIGWRDYDFPGRILYGTEDGREGDALWLAARFQDPTDIGYAQQLLADGQYFAGFEPHLQIHTPGIWTMMMNAADNYARVRQLPPSPARLPMTPGQPDFVFADEEDGVLALKHGDEILYISLYWRARYGINSIARVHHITPILERVATVYEDVQFVPSGSFYTRPDQVDWEIYSEVAPKGEVHQALAGEKLPIVQFPPGIPFKAGRESHFAGRADFYTLQYGPYLIAMNTTRDKTYPLKVPQGTRQAIDLQSGKTVTLEAPMKIPPRTTVVLYMSDVLKH
jgi:hypothetical protein